MDTTQALIKARLAAEAELSAAGIEATVVLHAVVVDPGWIYVMSSRLNADQMQPGVQRQLAASLVTTAKALAG